MTEFNRYLGKKRIYRQVVGSPSVYRVLVWNEEGQEYDPPVRGCAFEAYRYENLQGKSHRVKASFNTLKEARGWQADRLSGKFPFIENHSAEYPRASKGPLFSEVVAQYRKRSLPRLQETTQVSYLGKIEKYLTCFFEIPVQEFTSHKIDEIIAGWKQNGSEGMKSSRRFSFRHELEVLSAVLRYYDEYGDDSRFIFPIKRRHWRDVELNREKAVASKDLTEAEFLLFQAELLKTKFGSVLGPLAMVQYYQALRISEAGAIQWDDLKLDTIHPVNSRLLIRRKVVHIRQRGAEPYVKTGFKNSGRYGDVKEQPLFPGAYDALVSIKKPNAIGLVFHFDGKPIAYRTLQHYYNQAFRLAGLPYRSTHVLRHGWCREIFNANPDLNIAKQLLGDKSDEAAKVYAVRRSSALTAVVEKHWQDQESVRNCSQNQVAK